MKIKRLHIKNYKSIKELEIDDAQDALILVGRNNSGKSVILDAIRVALGDKTVNMPDFNGPEGNIIIGMELEFAYEDLSFLHGNGIVKKMKNYDLWLKSFCQRLPSFIPDEEGGGILTFEYVFDKNGNEKYRDGIKKNNTYIRNVLPRIYFVDHYRNNIDILKDIMMFSNDDNFAEFKADRCIFDSAKKCSQCFDCMGVINRKKPQELTLVETSRLMQYKMFSLNLNTFADRLNSYFSKNGGGDLKIRYEIKFDADELFNIETIVENPSRKTYDSFDSMGEGFRSIYILSLLETYINSDNDTAPYIIMIEEPETYLHPQLQKIASEILYRLSKKNQVIFSTHEPEMLFNFTTKQIRQIYCDEFHMTAVRKDTDIDDILNDLGFTANDMMNVSFVFIVEGKQDRSRLPLLLNKYYSEVYDENGRLRRIAIISTNSCTNIKTYANLKYINTLYLKDQFMMIRDSDGKDKQMLGKQLCRYYGERAKEDKGNMPRVTDRNVLILKYYSFENYFLFPEIMEKVGVVKSVDEFYDILWEKYNQYLYKLTSVKKMLSKLDISIDSRNDLIANIENIRIYVRGHNLYDIFYGRFKANENDVLSRYIELAPRKIFADILDKIDGFVYFDSRRR